ncbi:hypothetical protein PFISCL1PPCAC_11183, partial [Pristionchus fissidentatus]
MNKFLALLFVFAFVVCSFADDSSEESDEFDLSKPAAFIERHLSNETANLQNDVMAGIREFQDMNLTGFKAHFDHWPAHVQKLF